MVIFDIETTGLSKKDCGICQISLAKVDSDLNVVDTFNSYVKPRPDAVWNIGAMDCSGITPETVKDSPTLAQIADQVLAFIGTEDLLTYNGDTFDIPFLQEELKRCGRNLILSNRKIYDSYRIECALNSRKLTHVYKKYTGKELEGAHDSMNDVLGTLEVFKAQKNLVDVNKYISANTFGGVVGTDDDNNYIFLIGKYRGQHIKTVIRQDPDWVAWLIKEKRDNEFFGFIKQFYSEIQNE